MSWYDNKVKGQLDPSKPIVAGGGIDLFILLPQLGPTGYSVIGYNWFDLRRGCYNSSACFKTIEDAITGTYVNARNIRIVIEEP